MSSVLTWAAICAAMLAMILSAAGCATRPPAYLCRVAMNPQGETALFCTPLHGHTLPKDEA